MELEREPESAPVTDPGENLVWTAAILGDDLPRDGSGRSVELGERRIALFWIGDRPHAVDDACPHEGASLGDGVVVDGDVTCPWHSFHFDLTSGRNTDGLEHCIHVHPARLGAGGVVEVALASSS
jgi:nitrite reductase/ring-hydroxylating ferredoxin subunit